MLFPRIALTGSFGFTSTELDTLFDGPSKSWNIIGNLLQNALTHAHKAVTIRLMARADGDGVLFTVADDGPGIAPEYHDLIFRKFERVSSAPAPKLLSSGLGLAFCKLVVERHGGRIWVRSNVGEGSAFHVWLPRRPAEPQLAA